MVKSNYKRFSNFLNMITLLFHILMIMSLMSIFFIIFTKNSIYALWGLISHFFLTSILFFFLGIEFIGIIILIIYIGAIAILFIFGIMLLDLRALPHPKTSMK
jgi:NADH-quinone oxidoreductase subunit J